MHRLTRQVLRPFLFVLLPLFLVACGNGNNSTTDSDALALISSPVFAEHSVFVDGTDTKSWGANGYGQLGIGNKLNKTRPVAVTVTPTPIPTFSAVSIGGAHSVALDTAHGGNVWTWGLNSSGQLGDGTLVLKTSPVEILKDSNGSIFTGIKAIAAGGKHTLAIAADDTVWAWGYNATGQLGDGTITNSSTPKQVSSLTGVTAIAAGGDFSLALKSDGTVWAWGNNGKGQLGDNTFVTSKVPVQVLMHVSETEHPSLTGIIAIAAGGSHALALKDDGTVYAWGYNEFGQLGDGTITSSSTAVAVVDTGLNPDKPENKVVTAISAGLDHSVAIANGNVYTWGYNYYGQLGNGAALSSYLPVKELQTVQDLDGHDLSKIVEIIAAGDHCIARDSDGQIWTWGRNTHGELGDGTTVSRSKAKIILPAT